MGYRVLVVDDQKGVRRLLEELFKKEGYEVNVAVDGRDSIEKVKANTPDIVLMDMKMPNMNGLEASEEIIKYDRNIPNHNDDCLRRDGDCTESVGSRG